MRTRNISSALFGMSLLISCTQNPSAGKPSSGTRQFASSDLQGFAEISDLSLQKTEIRSDLKDLFCVHVYKLPLKADFSSELGVLCQDQKPTPSFTDFDRHASLVGSKPRAIRLDLSQGDDGYTRGLFGVVYRVPIQPKWVRSARIPWYMTDTSEFPYLKRSGSVVADSSNDLGGDLQFGKWDLSYHADIQTPAQTSFSNELKTQLNSFQVQGGNSDIGIGTEHLVDASVSGTPDYRVYNTTTITIGNEDKLSSTLITIVRVEVKNNGFPETAAKVISDSVTALATQVHDGLMAELAAGHFKP